MITFLSTGAGIVTLFLTLYFFPASYSKAGKLTIFAAACLFTLVFMAASGFLPMTNVVGILFLLILAVSYLISKRVEMVKVHEGWEEEGVLGDEEERTPLIHDDVLTSMNETHQLEEEVLPTASLLQPGPVLVEEENMQEVAFTDEMAEILDHRAHISEDEADIETLPLKVTKETDDLLERPVFAEEEHSQQMSGSMDQENMDESSLVSEDYIEELDFIQPLNNETANDLTEKSEKEEPEDVSTSSISIPELLNSEIEALFMEDYNLTEESGHDEETRVEQNDFSDEKSEHGSALDEELLALFEHDDAPAGLSSEQNEEEVVILSSMLNDSIQEIPEEDQLTEGRFSSDKEMQEVSDPVDEQEKEERFFHPALSDGSIQDILNKETNGESSEEVSVSEIEAADEVEAEMESSPVLRQQLWDIVLEQLQLYKQVEAPKEYEALLKEYLSASLSAHEHYVLATMLTRHYAEQHQYGQARELLVQLQQTYADHPVLLEELNYLEVIINN
ncbi:hypothetical protein [Priestia abyssalis]|uniref:hypothetical protein n=1 Tax=Priestia abyssalis TaxID=1221450 RepID=UPI0009959975|nr:hypothetical protein [Priestia abyssalis]